MNKKTNVCIYRIDQDDVIRWVNDEYDRFAAENDAQNLNAQTTIGRSLWDFITDKETEHLYKIMVKQVRKSQRELKFSLRCDGPACKRDLMMYIRPAGDGQVEFYSKTIQEIPRPAQNILKMDQKKSRDILVLCGWCNKVQLAGNGWVEVELATERLGLFNRSVLPELSHGMCPDCQQNFMGVFDDFKKQTV